MSPTSRHVAVFVACAAGVAAVAWLFLGGPIAPNRGPVPLAPGAGGDPAVGPGAGIGGRGGNGGTGPVEPGYVIVGGIKRKATDVASVPVAEKADARDDEVARDIDYGDSPELPENLNPAVGRVAEAIRDRKRLPYRLSVAAPPPPFDAAAYRADPQKYLDQVEPGRVFQTAQPGPDVPRLEAIGPYSRQVVQGQAVALEVQAPPGAPVTFTSFDLGQFAENQLTSVTVKADENGIAKAQFVGSPGTIADVNILAGSPLASAQAKFVVHVLLPKSSE